MIPYILIAAAVLAAVFGVPALVEPARRASARRAETQARRDADAGIQQQGVVARQTALARLWTEDPETAGVEETLRYKARLQDGLMQESLAQRDTRDQLEARVQHRRLHVRDGNAVTPGYRLRVLAGFALFPVVFVLGIVLDYLIFRGLHPTGTRLLPLALACLAVFGITAGSVLLLDARRHHLVPAAASPYVRRVVPLAGAFLAAGITVYMIVIAPYRSYPAGEARIMQAQQQLSSDQSLVLAGGGSNSVLISADRQALARARTDLAQAQRVDRVSAAVLAVLDIPLSEAGFLGAELLLLGVAERRRDQASKRVQQADNQLQLADTNYINALHELLTRHGHTDADQIIPRIIARVNRLLHVGSLLSLNVRTHLIQGHPVGAGQPGSAPNQPGQPGGTGAAGGSGAQGRPGPSGISASLPAAGPGAPQQGSPPGMPQPPGGPSAAGGAQGPGLGSVTVLRPGTGAPGGGTGVPTGNRNGPGTAPAPAVTVINPAGAPSQPGTAPAELPPEELDITA